MQHLNSKLRNSQISFKFINPPSYIDLSDDGLTAISNTECPDLGASIMTDFFINAYRIYQFHFKIKGDMYNCIMIGVGAPESFKPLNYCTRDEKSYGLYCGEGTKCRNNAHSKYFDGHLFDNQISIVVNMTEPGNGKLFFFIDGKNQGLAFEGLTLPLIPMITLWAIPDTVTIIHQPDYDPKLLL
jgi:hypothetical protein